MSWSFHGYHLHRQQERDEHTYRRASQPLTGGDLRLKSRGHFGISDTDMCRSLDSLPLQQLAKSPDLMSYLWKMTHRHILAG